MNKTATKARQVAFAARSQTDPKHYGELIGQTIDLIEVSNAAMVALKAVERDKLTFVREVRTREEKQIVLNGVFCGLVWVLLFWFWR